MEAKVNEMVLEELRHKNKMEEITTETEGRIKVERFKHEWELERMRIKNAEIRKSLMQKQDAFKYG